MSSVFSGIFRALSWMVSKSAHNLWTDAQIVVRRICIKNRQRQSSVVGCYKRLTHCRFSSRWLAMSFFRNIWAYSLALLARPCFSSAQSRWTMVKWAFAGRLRISFDRARNSSTCFKKRQSYTRKVIQTTENMTEMNVENYVENMDVLPLYTLQRSAPPPWTSLCEPVPFHWPASRTYRLQNKGESVKIEENSGVIRHRWIM